MDLEYENGKQLEVSIIKITESKENKSIHRLKVSGWGVAQQVQGGGGGGGCPTWSWGGGAVAPLVPPPLATALHSPKFSIKERLYIIWCAYFANGDLTQKAKFDSIDAKLKSLAFPKLSCLK